MTTIRTLDLHVHSALSPCAAREMSPPEVLLTAELSALGIIGIVDHNSAGNASAFLQAARAFAVDVLVGLEIESVEGVHLLALFDNEEAAQSMSRLVCKGLPHLANRPDIFGDQTLLDMWGDEIGTEHQLLMGASELGVERIAEETIAREGLSIAAHIDRMANGLLPTLGFIPPRLQVDFLEVSRRMSFETARQRWPELVRHPLITGSDAHCLDDIGQGGVVIPNDLTLHGKSFRQWAGNLREALLTGGADRS